MSDIQLIYFKDCPLADKARQTLKQLHLDFTEVIQDDLPEGDPLKNYSSPTILNDDVIIFGTQLSGGGGCSLNMPGIDELRKTLSRLKK